MQTITNTSDKRVVKTRRAIRSAFESLLAEKDVAQISVKDIADRALISRKTFYMHYTSVRDVLSEIESDLTDTLRSKLNDVELSPERFDPTPAFRKIGEVLDSDESLYSRLIRSSAGDSLADAVKTAVKDKLSDTVGDKLRASKAQVDCVVEFISSGMVSAWRQWFTGDRSQPLDEVSETISEVAASGMNQLIAPTATSVGSEDRTRI